MVDGAAATNVAAVVNGTQTDTTPTLASLSAPGTACSLPQAMTRHARPHMQVMPLYLPELEPRVAVEQRAEALDSSAGGRTT